MTLPARSTPLPPNDLLPFGFAAGGFSNDCADTAALPSGKFAAISRGVLPSGFGLSLCRSRPPLSHPLSPGVKTLAGQGSGESPAPILNDEGMMMDEKERNTAATPMSNQARGVIGAAQGHSEACRMSAREAIKEEVRRLRSKAGALEALARQIPDGFPTDADAALWQLFNDARR